MDIGALADRQTARADVYSFQRRLMDAALTVESPEPVERLASEHLGCELRVVVPRLLTLRAAGDAIDPLVLDYVTGRVDGDESAPPATVLAESPVEYGGELAGLCMLLVPAQGSADLPDESVDVLHGAALASAAVLGLIEARESVAEGLRGPFFEELRSNHGLEPTEILRRAGNLGCDLSRGVVALCAEVKNERPRQFAATVSADYPGALAQALDDRVYALLPAIGADDAAEQTSQRAHAIAERLKAQADIGISSFYGDPSEYRNAVQEAELVVDVVRSGAGDLSGDVGHGTYRLLFRILASHPEEVTAFYRDTIAPLVRYDDQYRTDLVGTLEAYLAADCNMNATATAIFAHRHTVSYRLERIAELTGLDPLASEDRERLGLGLKAFRIIAPTLPK